MSLCNAMHGRAMWAAAGSYNGRGIHLGKLLARSLHRRDLLEENMRTHFDSSSFGLDTAGTGSTDDTLYGSAHYRRERVLACGVTTVLSQESLLLGQPQPHHQRERHDDVRQRIARLKAPVARIPVSGLGSGSGSGLGLGSGSGSGSGLGLGLGP